MTLKLEFNRHLAVVSLGIPVLMFACSDRASAGAQHQTNGIGQPLDAHAIEVATGGSNAEVSGDVVKVSFPRKDVPIQIDGSTLPPFMGLTSYAAFMPAAGQAMVMGDVVLFEDEVNPALSAALDNGLEVTALHNHFFFDNPHVYFMHIGGMGTIDTLGSGFKAVLDAQRTTRQAAPQPANAFGAPVAIAPSQIDAATLDGVFGLKGATKDGMYKATFGRTTSSTMCNGCSIGKAMGVNTWAAFAGTDGAAVVDGDFAVTEPELQPVLRALRAGGINIVAIHHHMTEESPRILFLHYWGRGTTSDLARTILSAVNLTAWDGRASASPTSGT